MRCGKHERCQALMTSPHVTTTKMHKQISILEIHKPSDQQWQPMYLSLEVISHVECSYQHYHPLNAQ